MFHRPTLACALLAAAAVPALALAEDRPLMTPTRDVAITYRVLGPRQGTLHMSIQAGSGLTRVESPNRPGYAIVDRKTLRMTVVMPEQRVFLEVPSPPGQQSAPDLDPTAKFTRHGTDTVAGVSCTVWDFTAANGAGSMCVTEDGAMLRAQNSSGKGGIEATEVSYAALKDADFHPPADFTQQAMPPVGNTPPGQTPPR